MSKKSRAWDIKKTKSSLGLSACTNIFFVHAFLGCDTTSDTSRLHGIGKGVALKKLTTDVLLYQQAAALTAHLLQRKRLFWRVKKRCSVCTIANHLMKALIHCGTLDFISKLRQEQTVNNLCTAREPSTNVGSCRVSQPESVLPSTAVERTTAQA